MTLAATSAIAVGHRPARAAMPSRHVLEFRQYKIARGKRDAFVDLFEREFVESQEALGMRLVGLFRDLDDPDRFTWLREFPNMEARVQALDAFYFGPVWTANRSAANALLEDNDDVLLLRAAMAGADFGPSLREQKASGLVVATVHYLWKDPVQGFTCFFEERVAPALQAAGLPVIGSFVQEEAPNNFPRLPVRRGEKVFVWFTRVADVAEHRAATDALLDSSAWTTAIGPMLADFEERAPQVLRLQPTPRSALR